MYESKRSLQLALLDDFLACENNLFFRPVTHFMASPARENIFLQIVADTAWAEVMLFPSKGHNFNTDEKKTIF